MAATRELFSTIPAARYSCSQNLGKVVLLEAALCQGLRQCSWSIATFVRVPCSSRRRRRRGLDFGAFYDGAPLPYVPWDHERGLRSPTLFDLLPARWRAG